DEDGRRRPDGSGVPPCQRSLGERRQEQREADGRASDENPGQGSHRNASSRGSSRETFWRFSSASRSAFVSFVGTVSATFAIRSPRPEPFSFGAPRPLIFSSFPSCEPAGIFSVTGPSGVGTSTLAPSAASV